MAARVAATEVAVFGETEAVGAVVFAIRRVETATLDFATGITALEGGSDGFLANGASGGGLVEDEDVLGGSWTFVRSLVVGRLPIADTATGLVNVVDPARCRTALAVGLALETVEACGFGA